MACYGDELEPGNPPGPHPVLFLSAVTLHGLPTDNIQVRMLFVDEIPSPYLINLSQEIFQYLELSGFVVLSQKGEQFPIGTITARTQMVQLHAVHAKLSRNWTYSVLC